MTYVFGALIGGSFIDSGIGTSSENEKVTPQLQQAFRTKKKLIALRHGHEVRDMDMRLETWIRETSLFLRNQ